MIRLFLFLILFLAAILNSFSSFQDTIGEETVLKIAPELEKNRIKNNNLSPERILNNKRKKCLKIQKKFNIPSISSTISDITIPFRAKRYNHHNISTFAKN